MTAHELIASLRILGPQDANVIFTFLADHVYDSTLKEGQHIRDASDFKAWLAELAEAAKGPALADTGRLEMRRRMNGNRPAQPRNWDDTCPRCGHVHQGERECGQEMGRGALCRCELSVPA